MYATKQLKPSSSPYVTIKSFEVLSLIAKSHKAMLNRRNRIGDSDKIEKLAKAGNVFKSDFLLFRYAKMDSLGQGQSVPDKIPNRFAVNVSKRIDKRAVVRNRLRRQVNEALRLNLSLLPEGYRVLVSARSSAAQKKPEFKELNKAVIAFFNTLRIHAK